MRLVTREVKELLTHETRGVVGIGSDLVVHFDEPLHQNEGHLPLGQGILQSVTKKDDQGQAFAGFVGTGGGLGGKDTTHFVQHPVFGGIQPFEMFLRSARLELGKKERK